MLWRGERESGSRDRNRKSLVGLGKVAGHEVVLAKPQTMMNLSGVAVRMLLERYEGEPADLIVLLDEADLPWGMLRIRDKGRNSTHNGLKSIISALGTDEFIRVANRSAAREIVGRSQGLRAPRMGREERKIAEDVLIDAVRRWK